MTTFSLRKLSALTGTIAWSEFKLRYAGSVLGYFWSVSKPLMLFAVMYVVFSKVLRFGDGIAHYPVMLLLAIVLWTFFSETTTAGVSILVSRADLLRKVSFPSVALPVAVGITASLAMAFNLLAVLAISFAVGIEPTRYWLLLPFLLLELFLVAIGVTLVLSAMFVYFRDIGQIWEVVSQALFYGSPIIYPLALIPAGTLPTTTIQWKAVVLVNPLAQIIEQSRRIMVQGSNGSLSDVLTGRWVLVPYLLAALTLLMGGLLYRRVAPRMVEML